MSVSVLHVLSTAPTVRMWITTSANAVENARKRLASLADREHPQGAPGERAAVPNFKRAIVLRELV